MGRPSIYSQETLDTIVDGLERGVPLTVICEPDDMPAPRTVHEWAQKDEAISAAIARARELGEVALAEQCLRIADDESHDWEMSKKGPILNEVAIGRAKLQIDTRLKLLAKFNPRKWGDKLELAGDAERPLTVNITRLAP